LTIAEREHLAHTPQLRIDTYTRIKVIRSLSRTSIVDADRPDRTCRTTGMAAAGGQSDCRRYQEAVTWVA
jgi:hypothetical protein